ncbi:MAG: LacI family transcriptional regulator [Bacilli bacterium]|nr:LacI family transcriptional regulator [Bacilli bacterium]
MPEAKIKDVAKEAGVSAITITRVLHTPELVKPATRIKVQAAIDKLGYVPNYSAAVLRSAKSHTVGINLFDIENPFISQLITRLKDNLSKHNYSTLVSFENERETNDYLLVSRLKAYNVDLVIFIPTKYDERIQQMEKENKDKCIQLFRPIYKGMDSIKIDDSQGGYLGTKYLLENGHKRILLIDYDQTIPMGRDIGYKKALKEAGLKFNPESILLLKENEPQTYADVIREKIISYKPTAIFSVTQKITMAAMTSLKQVQKRIFDDVSLVAYDDSPLLDYLSITAIAHPFNKIVDSLTELSLQKLQSPTGETKEIFLSPYLEIRSSVKKIN